MEAAAPFRIIDAFMLPVVATEMPGIPASWDELDRALDAQALDVNFMAAEVVEGHIQPIHGLDADQPLGIGSTYKLYVLGELARQIADGHADWDEKLAIRTDWKGAASQGADFLACEPEGAAHTLREYAE
jgi:beta-lactamase class A